MIPQHNGRVTSRALPSTLARKRAAAFSATRDSSPNVAVDGSTSDDS